MMKKNVITMKCNIVVLCLIVGMLFVSCSSDDEGNNDDTIDKVELPANVLRTYNGILQAPPVNVGGATATLVETSSKTYTINFSNDVPSITGVQFIAGPNTIFTTIPKDKEDRGITVVLAVDMEGNRIITAVKENDPEVTFIGEK